MKINFKNLNEKYAIKVTREIAYRIVLIPLWKISSMHLKELGLLESTNKENHLKNIKDDTGMYRIYYVLIDEGFDWKTFF